MELNGIIYRLLYGVSTTEHCWWLLEDVLTLNRPWHVRSMNLEERLIMPYCNCHVYARSLILISGFELGAAAMKLVVISNILLLTRQ